MLTDEHTSQVVSVIGRLTPSCGLLTVAVSWKPPLNTCLPAGQLISWQRRPLRSMCVSLTTSMFVIPQSTLASQTPPMHSPIAQSDGAPQASPSSQPGQTPPQSMSDSSWLRSPSEHDSPGPASTSPPASSPGTKASTADPLSVGRPPSVGIGSESHP